MAMTIPPANNSLETVAKMIDAAHQSATIILSRLGRTADHLGGGIPRCVAKDSETESVGMVGDLMARLNRLIATLSMTQDEMGRVETFTGVAPQPVQAGTSQGLATGGIGYRG